MVTSISEESAASTIRVEYIKNFVGKHLKNWKAHGRMMED
jgi:hypothetical protein